MTLGGCVLALAVLGAEPERRPIAIGEPATTGALKDTRFLNRSLSELAGEKATVLAFFTNTCPLAKRYWPVLVRLEQDYRSRGVRFLGVNVGRNDGIVAIADQGLEHDVPFPLFKDAKARLAQSLGVTHTPQVVVLDEARRLRYRGRIDDQMRPGGTRPNPTRDDLKAALEDILAGRPVAIGETLVDGCVMPSPGESTPTARVEFARDVAPIVQRHCQECHRPGGEAPFSLGTYEEVSSHGATLAEVVGDGRMPPWYASPRHREFVQRRGLSDAETATLLDWVTGGMPPGARDRQPKPPLPVSSEWLIGTPDHVITMLGKYTLPATGYVPYQYVVLPYVFTHDTWVEGVQIVADNPRVVHHCNLGCFQVGGDVRRPQFITGKVPGGVPLQTSPRVAFCIARGSVLGLQVHYTTTGKAETCQLRVGLRYARSIVQKRLRHLQVANTRFTIPPGAPHHKVTATRTLPCDATGVGMFAHMHVRGKDMTFIAHPPGKPSEQILAIPNYSFDWQQAYRWPEGTKRFTKGTRIECVGHFDNSPLNPFNPDPKVTVVEGQQTFNEMLYGFFFYTDDGENLNLRINPKTGAVVHGTKPGG